MLHERLHSTEAHTILASPKNARPIGTPPSEASGYSPGILVFFLALVVLVLFYVQGSTIDMSRVGTASKAGWSRIMNLNGVSLRRGSEDSQVLLIQELTEALEEATTEIEAADKEIFYLRSSMRKFEESSEMRGVSGEASEDGLEKEAVPAVSQVERRMGASVASPGKETTGGGGTLPSVTQSSQGAELMVEVSDPEIEEALRSLPYLSIPASNTDVSLPCTACLRHGSGLAKRVCLPAPCPFTPPGAARIVSTSLYGDNPRYTWGVVRNAELMPTVFPGWHLRVYTRSDMLPPQEILEELKSLGAELVVIPGEKKSSGFGMNWRFLVADDKQVEAFLCRDADSRVSLRDRWAAEEWLAEGAGGSPFHVVRDHPSHTGYKLMGGTWGAKTSVFRGPLVPLSQTLGNFIAQKGHGDYGSDIDFLSEMIWPQMAKLGVKQHDSHSCGVGNHGVQGFPFPRPRAGTEHVGAVYVYEGERETVRQIDLTLLQQSRGAPDCVPLPVTASQRRGLSMEEALDEAEPLDPSEFLEKVSTTGDEGGSDAHSAPTESELLFLQGHATAWNDGKEGICSSAFRVGSKVGEVCVPALLHWKDTFVDRVSRGAGGGGRTSFFTYHSHVNLGTRPGDVTTPPPLQYHERVPPTVEPIQALDGGVRYYPSLALVDPAYGLGGPSEPSDGEGLAAFAKADLPRLLGSLARPDTLVLLPSAQAAAARELAGEWKEHIVEHEEGEASLYFARHLYVLTCKCS